MRPRGCVLSGDGSGGTCRASGSCLQPQRPAPRFPRSLVMGWKLPRRPALAASVPHSSPLGCRHDKRGGAWAPPPLQRGLPHQLTRETRQKPASFWLSRWLGVGRGAVTAAAPFPPPHAPLPGDPWGPRESPAEAGMWHPQPGASRAARALACALIGSTRPSSGG